MLQTQWLVAVSRRTSLPFYSAASLTTATAAGMEGGIIAWTRGRSLVASCKLLVSSCQLLHGGPLCVALLILQPCLILLNGCEWIRLSTNFITNKHHVASLSVGRAFGPMGHGSWLGSLAWPESDSFRCRCKWRDPIRLRLFASVPTENTKKKCKKQPPLVAIMSWQLLLQLLWFWFAVFFC